MKIVRLQLKNFCQHKELDLNFSSGIFGIIGPNGAGKSNIIRAIAYGITGYVADTKASYLRYGTTTGSVLLHVQMDTTGEEFAIKRTLENSDMSLYSVSYEGTSPTYTLISNRPTECKAYLSERLQIDASLVQQVLAVPQEDWGAFFKETASKRHEMLSRLFSLSFIRSKRQAFNGIYSILLKAFTEACAKRDTLQEQERRLGILIDSLQEVSEYDMTALNEQHDLYEKMKKEVFDKLSTLKMYTFLHQSLNESKKRLTDLDQQIAETSLDKPELSYDPDELVKLRLIVQSNQLHMERLRKLRKKIVELDKVLGNPKEEVQLEYLNQCKADLDKFHQDLGELKNKFMVYNWAKSHSECPVCHNPMEVDQSQVDAIQKELKEVEEKIEKKKTEVNNLSKRYEEYVGYQSYINSAIQNINDEATANSLSILVKDLRPEACKDLLATIDKELQKADTYIDNVTWTIDNYNKRVRELDEWQNKFDRLNIERDEVMRRMLNIQNSPEFNATITESEADLTFKQNTLSKQTQELLDQITKRSQYDAYVTERGNVQKELEAVTSLIKPYAGDDGLLANYKKVLDVLSPGELPTLATNAIFKLLIKYINDYLIALNAEFTVYLDDKNDIFCTFNTGLVQPASRLSGGEKVLLAIALRLAIHTAFTGSDNGGFIVLDEPTTFLDDANRDAVKNVLMNIRGSAMFGNFQVIVITHDDALVPLCDTVCTLEAKQ